MFEFSRVLVALANANGPDRAIDALIACSVAARFPSSLMDMKEHEKEYGLDDVMKAVCNPETTIGKEIPKYTESLDEIEKLADELLPEFHIDIYENPVIDGTTKVAVKWADKGQWQEIRQIGDCITVELSALQALFMCIRYLEFKQRVEFKRNHWVLLTKQTNGHIMEL